MILPGREVRCPDIYNKLCAAGLVVLTCDLRDAVEHIDKKLAALMFDLWRFIWGWCVCVCGVEGRSFVFLVESHIRTTFPVCVHSSSFYSFSPVGLMCSSVVGV